MHKRVDIKTGFLCNNNCLFCVQRHNKFKGNKSKEDIFKDLQKAKKTGCNGVVFTGGEVSIRKDLFELISYAKNLGFSTIQVQSNARRFYYKDFCKKVVEAGMTEFAPALHGHTAELHNYLTRSKGSFNQVVQAIKNIKELGIYIVTNTVVVKPNYRYLPQIAKLLISLDVDQFQFAFVHATGAAHDNFETMVPKVSLASPYIHKGLQLGIDANIKVMAEAMPYCVMKGYEDYISELYIPETEIREMDRYDPNFTFTRKNEGKIKFPQCKECIYDFKCEGPWKEYPEKMGTDEFKPILKVTVPKSININEFYPLAFNLKNCQKNDANPDEIKEIKEFYNHFGISILTSDYKYKSNFGLGTPLPINHNKGKVIFYASKNKEITLKLKELDKISNFGDGDFSKITKELGQLLGYPECCIDYFIKIHHLTNPQIYFEILKNTNGKQHSELNPFENNGTFISHIPCSFNCQESLKIANKNMTVLDFDLNNNIGTYLFFNDGSFIKLNLKENGNYITEYYSKGKFISKMSISQLIIFKKIQEGNKITFNDNITIFNDKSLIYTIKKEEWGCFKFE